MPQLGNVLFAVVLLRDLGLPRIRSHLPLMTGGGPAGGGHKTCASARLREGRSRCSQMGRALAVAVADAGIMIVFIGLYFRLAGEAAAWKRLEIIHAGVICSLVKTFWTITTWFLVLVITFPLIWMIGTALQTRVGGDGDAAVPPHREPDAS